MSGETDLSAMLATLEVERRAGQYTFVSVPEPHPTLAAAAAAVIDESEGTTYVLSAPRAAELGYDVEFRGAWLTLKVHSALEAVGLTAAFSAALTANGISCNVLAGFYHDHLLVPVERADDALEALARLRDQHRGGS